MKKTLKIADLVYYEKNAKQHPPEQIDRIKRSIERFGFRGGIQVTIENVIITGHGRIAALKELGHKEVEVDVIEDLKPDDIKAFRIADNKTAESDWDFELLKSDMLDLKTEKYDLSLTGFDRAEIDDIFDPSIKNTNKEIDIDEEEFEHECPKCSFKF